MSEQPADAPRVESLNLARYGNEQDLVDAALAYAQAALPEWTPREGNAQPLTTAVLTPRGWSTMGALAVGDDVSAPDGKPSVVTGIFPKGKLPTYRVSFNDGTSTLASEDHLWLIDHRYKGGRNPGKPADEVVRTSDLARMAKLPQRGRPRLPRIVPQEIGDTAPLPLDPWLLGFLLGDGGLTRDSVKFTASEAENVQRVADSLPGGARVNHYGGIEYSIVGTETVGRNRHNPVRAALESLGVFGKGSVDKFIPDPYLNGSIKTRLAVLRGLMDADGYAGTSGTAEFSSVSRQLAHGVARIVRSLGERANVQFHEKRFYTSPTQTTKTRARGCYRVNMRMPEHFNPFLLERKAALHKAPTGPQFHRVLESVEYVGDMECQCISVSSSSSLYVTDDYIPTHNTEVVLMESLAVMLGPELLSIRLAAAEVVEQLVGLFGVTRDAGSPVAGRLQVNVTNSKPLQVIPRGSRFRLQLADTEQTVDFLTAEELQIITTDTLGGSVRIVAEQLGETGNRTPGGTKMDVVDPLPFIESAVTVGTLQEGTGPETDSAFQGRAAAQFARLTSTLVGADTFRFAALSRPNVGRALVRDNLNPAAPAATSYGHVTIAAANADGEPLSDVEADALEAFLTGQAIASLTVHVVSPTYTTVSFAITVTARPGFTDAEVKENVEYTLRSWMDPATWTWGASITANSVVGKVYAAEGVAEVISVPATKTLAGIAPLPRVGTITVTVNR